jgi:release factor glutamine methyltransferase
MSSRARRESGESRVEGHIAGPTIAECLRQTRDALSNTSASAHADAELLLSHVLERDRSFLIAHREDALTDSQVQRLRSLVERRAAGEPVAYLIGTAWFCGRPFTVNPHVLVPRPETEHLAQAAIEHLASYARPVALDVGTGCGAIARTLAAELPHCTVYATERSAEALEVAEENAPGVYLERADLLPSTRSLGFDGVIANLPYVPTAELPCPPDPASFEPREALDGGPDGLREYRRLLELLPARLNAGAIVLLEAAPPTIAALHDLSARALPKAKLDIGYDYAGLERFVSIRLRGRSPNRGC